MDSLKFSHSLGAELPTTTINAVRLDKDQINYSRLVDKDTLNALNSWFDSCHYVEQSEETPIIIKHNNFSQARTFYFYPDRSLILAKQEGKILNLVKSERLFSLDVFLPPETDRVTSDN
jgi:hypothetical protein